ALHIAEIEHDDIAIFDASSIGSDAIGRFTATLKETPDVGDAFKVVSTGKQFSSRIVFDLIPAATSAWTRLASTAERVPNFILSYVAAAYDYISKEEWRTSIVLSAIALESLIAEMYENEFKKIAP